MWDPNKDVQKYLQFKQKCVRKTYFQGSTKTRLALNLGFFGGGGNLSQLQSLYICLMRSETSVLVRARANETQSRKTLIFHPKSDSPTVHYKVNIS